jgi:hypothetical protein
MDNRFPLHVWVGDTVLVQGMEYVFTEDLTFRSYGDLLEYVLARLMSRFDTALLVSGKAERGFRTSDLL